MKEYHKINTVFKRNPETKFKTLLMGEFALPEFEYLKDCQWVFTEKVDGTNVRVMIDAQKGSVIFGGKTDNAQIPSTLTNGLNDLFLTTHGKANLLNQFVGGGKNVCLYGEGFGAKIQSGGNYSCKQEFCLFDVWVDGWWLKREDVQDIAEKLGIQVVPVIGNGVLMEMVAMVEHGFDSQWGSFRAEGIVARPAIELTGRNGHRIITKIKHKDFK